MGVLLGGLEHADAGCELERLAASKTNWPISPHVNQHQQDRREQEERVSRFHLQDWKAMSL